jgi:hypothetical protein
MSDAEQPFAHRGKTWGYLKLGELFTNCPSMSNQIPLERSKRRRHAGTPQPQEPSSDVTIISIHVLFEMSAWADGTMTVSLYQPSAWRSPSSQPRFRVSIRPLNKQRSLNRRPRMSCNPSIWQHHTLQALPNLFASQALSCSSREQTESSHSNLEKP